jgi:hypothetical protein
MAQVVECKAMNSNLRTTYTKKNKQQTYKSLHEEVEVVTLTNVHHKSSDYQEHKTVHWLSGAH